MASLHHAEARPRPASEPPPRPSLSGNRDSKAAEHRAEDKRWFRFPRMRGHQPKVWAATSAAAGGGVLPPPPPSPPSMSQPDGTSGVSEASSQSTPHKSVVASRSDASVTNGPDDDVLSGRSSLPDVAAVASHSSPGRAGRASACGTRCQGEGRTTRVGHVGDVKESVETMATKTLAAPKEAPCEGKAYGVDTEPGAVQQTSEMKVVLQPGSRAPECRSPGKEEGIVGADVPLTLPSSRSIQPSEEDTMLEGEVRAPDGYVNYHGTRRNRLQRGHRTDVRANTEAGAPAGGSLPSARTVVAGMTVLCLDISCPQDGGPEVKRWRSAEVVDVIRDDSGPTEARVKILSTGNPIVTLRLKEDWERLAQPLLLTEEEIASGAPLQGEALATSKKMFRHRSRTRGRSKGGEEGSRTRGESRSGSRRHRSSLSASRANPTEAGSSSGAKMRRSSSIGGVGEIDWHGGRARRVHASMDARADGGVEPSLLADSIALPPEEAPAVAGSAVVGGGSSLVNGRGLPPRSAAVCGGPGVLRDSAGPSGRSEGGDTGSQGRRSVSSPPSSRKDGVTRSSLPSLSVSDGSERRAQSGARGERDAPARNGASGRRRSRGGEEKRVPWDPGLVAGDKFDCLDHFVSHKTGKEASKWREAEVLEVRHSGDTPEDLDVRILVHFLTWGSKWDCWISWTHEWQRFAPHLTRALPAKERCVQEPSASRQGSGGRSSSGGQGRGSASRDYLSNAVDDATRSRPGAARDQGADRTPRIDEPLPPRANGGSAGGARGSGLGGRRPRSPGRGVVARGDRVSTGSKGLTSGGCSSSPADSEVDSVGSSDEQFREAMRRKGLSVVDVEPDGNCLFRSVSHQIYGDANRHNQVRKACVDHMSKHKSRFGVFVAEDFRGYLCRIRQPGVWGDDLEIRALEELFDRPIEIYSSEAEDLRPMKIDFDATGLDLETIPIKLSYHGQSHYNSVTDGSLKYPLHPLRTKKILHVRQAQHARTPRSASVSRAGGGRAGEEPDVEALNRRASRRPRLGRLKDPFSLLARSFCRERVTMADSLPESF